MNIYQEHFKTIFSTKKNIRALKNEVLNLAIQGKLVEQRTEDKPASELIEMIQLEKEQLIRDKKIKKETLSRNIVRKEMPFIIPKKWEWVRLGDVAVIKGGKRIPKGYHYFEEKTEHVYLRVTDMKKGTIDLKGLKYIDDEVFEKIKNYTISKEELYITVAGTIGDIGTIPEEVHNMSLTENANKIMPIKINKFFLKYFLESGFVQNQMKEKTTQMAQPKLSIRNIQDIIFPIASLEEQEKIVCKIDTLMSEIDQLELLLDKKNSLEKAIPKAVVSAIAKCKDEDELRTNLVRVINHFSEIYHTPDSLQELRDVIIQLGIQGKLLTQAPDDEPAIHFLSHIQKEKEQLFKKKQNKNEKRLSELEEVEIPWIIPDKWEWEMLGNVLTLVSGRDLKPAEYNNQEKGVPYLTGASNFSKGNLIINRWTEKPKVISQAGDLLITVKGTIGDMAFQDIKEAHIARQIMALRNDYYVDMNYVHYFLQSYVHLLQENAKSIIPGISRDDLLKAPIPIPPIEEQPRIVAKINSLMVLIDQLEIEMGKKEVLVENMATIQGAAKELQSV
ncbi:restriction endonuclease subunit S [Desemzia sp. FAM 23991]|uniref:restriction endonuclease subunit S n=1 Tax=unclassified Desemzia TaxID=2685243 RepID=UPI003885B46F